MAEVTPVVRYPRRRVEPWMIVAARDLHGVGMSTSAPFHVVLQLTTPGIAHSRSEGLHIVDPFSLKHIKAVFTL